MGVTSKTSEPRCGVAVTVRRFVRRDRPADLHCVSVRSIRVHHGYHIDILGVGAVKLPASSTLVFPIVCVPLAALD